MPIPVAPVIATPPRPALTPAPQLAGSRPATPPHGTRNDLDDALLKELEITLEKDHVAAAGRPVDDAADKAVSRLMSDLTAKR